MGFSFEGAQEFLAFYYNKNNMYAYASFFYVVVKTCCLSTRGFPVVRFWQIRVIEDITVPFPRSHVFAKTIGCFCNKKTNVYIRNC